MIAEAFSAPSPGDNAKCREIMNQHGFGGAVSGVAISQLESEQKLQELKQKLRGQGTPIKANELQVGGEHYKDHGKHQVWDLVVDMGWCFFVGNIVKYIHRYKRKGGVQDLQKARHYLDKLIEIEQAKEVKGDKS